MPTQSILNSVKKVCGLSASDVSFDDDLMLHINSILSVLTQLGIGPEDGFMIEDDVATWEDFLGTDKLFNGVKTYVYLRTRILFDPPATSFVIEAMEKQISEFEWRLSVQREGASWLDPTMSIV